ncbi:hypothetical protein GCM10018793_30380 [Streptomyces sulfonofaciens]|uniref:Uncharacterized protein n=1 Tax=Streptomyces sulfonofaciens TaxID=68272 RepID=A0A919G685_9ACTN|nr:hypothetical protein [Streptomyces sulfonofaciens]GHH78848.1 hypothetical protein GCM10018793_30380 [Streptomyces sulfonofaciens]
MPNESDATELREWKKGAQDLLIAVAEEMDINPPDLVLSQPQLLFDTFRELLRSIPIEDLNEDEFYILNSQLAALIAQVLIVEHEAVWMVDTDTKSLSHGHYVLSRQKNSEATPYKVDPFMLVKAELNSEAVDFNRLIGQARTLITWDHPDIG